MRACVWITGLILTAGCVASGCGSRTSALLDTVISDAGTGSGSGGSGSGSSGGSASSSGGGSGSSSGSVGTDSGACSVGESLCAGLCCGGTCTSGRCLVTLASAPLLDDIAVDTRAVYWTDPSDGTVLSVPPGGGAVTTLASGQMPDLIAVNGSSVFWDSCVTNASCTIMQLPLSGGAAPATLASGQNPYGLAADATSVYWTNFYYNQSSVLRMPAAGGPVTALVSGLFQVHGIAVDAANVYWTGTTIMGASSSLVLSVPIGGGSVMTVAQTAQPAYDIAALPLPVVPGQLAQNVYWTAGTNPQIGLFTAQAAGGSEVTLSTHAQTQLAVDATTVYWTTSNAVMSVPAAGGTPVKLAAMGGGAIAVDATSVYWVSIPPFTGPSVDAAPPPYSLMKLTPK